MLLTEVCTEYMHSESKFKFRHRTLVQLVVISLTFARGVGPLGLHPAQHAQNPAALMADMLQKHDMCTCQCT